MTSNRTTSSRPWVGPPPSSAAAGWALLPFRAFVGGTFTFAGMQKLANPGFFDATNPTSIQAQLKSVAHSSPIHALVVPLEHVAVALGVLLALGEIAVGVGTLLGLWSRIAAAGGMAISLGLFLTVSFHASPYYTGADIVFLFAWMPLLVAGSGGVLSVDAYLAARAPDPTAPVPVPARAGELDRRTFALRAVAVGGVGAIGVLLAGLAAGVGRLVGHSATAAGAGLAPTGTVAGATTTAPGPSQTVPKGKKVLSASMVALGGAATFTDPKTGDPAVVVQPTAGTFVAFDAVCPHEGCTVAFSPPSGRFICPCHGSTYNGTTGALLKGPSTRGLSPITIAEGPDGELYAV